MSRVIRTPEENGWCIKPQIKWVKQVDCPMCHAFIEYNNLDVYKKLDGYNFEMEVIDCPYCKKWFCID